MNDPSPSHDGRATFYTVSDSGFFVGTVALLNSLRLTGHTDPLVVLDCGFSERQRSILEPHCRLIPFDRSLARSPTCFKPFAHLTEPTGTVAIIDSDIVVVGSLDAILDEAGRGRICAFTDSSPRRHFTEWQELFSLSLPPRQQPYVNSGFVAFSVDRWPDLLSDWWTACATLWSKPYVRGGRSDPVQFPDQDSLNALLMSEIDADALEAMPISAMPFGALLSRVRVEDPRRLLCSCDGSPATLLHNSGDPKPWDPNFRRAWVKWRPAYVGLLRRVLVDPDVLVRPSPEDLPAWLRPGLLGASLERLISGAATLRFRTRGLRASLRGSRGHPTRGPS